MHEYYLRSYLQKSGFLWQYEGGYYLVELASGKISNLYVNCTGVVQNPQMLQACVTHLIEKLKLQVHIDWVVGSAMGGINIAYEFAKQLGCKAGFTEKDGNGGMTLKRFDVSGDVLVVEDVITTGGTTLATLQAIAPKANVYHEVPCLVYRGRDSSQPFTSVPILHLSGDTWDHLPAQHKDCKPVKAKANWHLLTSKSACMKCTDGTVFPFMVMENGHIRYKCRNCGDQEIRPA